MAWGDVHEAERLRVNRSVLVHDFMLERRQPVLQYVHLAQLRYEGEQRVVAHAGGFGR